VLGINLRRHWMTTVLALAVCPFLLVSSSQTSSDFVKLVTMPDYGDVIKFKLTSDGQTVVFTADMEVDELPELYSIPLSGGTPIKLNNVSSTNGVSGFMLSPDGTRAVYVVDNDLYSVPVEGPRSDSVKLHDNGVMCGYVHISADSKRVVYPIFQDMFTAKELYSTSIEGGTPVRLNRDMVGTLDHYYIVLSPDSQYVVYRADQDSLTANELYSVPIDGPASAGVKLNGALPPGGDVEFKQFNVSPDSKRVVYIADQTSDEVHEIYSVSITGSSLSRAKLNDPLPVGGDVDIFRISPEGSRVVYKADQDEDEIMELYSVPLTGGDPVKLNHEMIEERGSIGDDVHAFEISPDGKNVVFEASWVNVIYNYPEEYNTFWFNVYELFSVPVDGFAGQEIKLWGPSEKAGYGNGDRSVTEAVLDAVNHPFCEINFNHRGDTVVYRIGYPLSEYCVLWRAPVDGSLQAERLYAGEEANYPEIEAYQVTRDDAIVVYAMAYDSEQLTNIDLPTNTISDQTQTRLTELFGVLLGGPAEASRKLNGTLVTGGSVAGFELSANSQQVVYKADQDTFERQELYLADLSAIEPVPWDHALYLPMVVKE
jgi:Tol biopolymer transport system component